MVELYPKANNKKIKGQSNLDKRSVFVRYTEASNFYGWTMIQKLSTDSLMWEEKVDDFSPKKEI